MSKFEKGPSYPRMTLPEDDRARMVALDDETATQTWFRFLQLIENPVQLADASSIARKPKFIGMAKLNSNRDDPLTTNHPCLANLPLIFLRTMEGLVLFPILTSGLVLFPFLSFD